MTLIITLLISSPITRAAPIKKVSDSDENRLTNALLRLDDALDTLAAYFKDSRRGEFDDSDIKHDAEDIDEPKPERPEAEERGEDADLLQNQDGSRPEITAELEEISEKELAEVPDGQHIEEDDEAIGEDDDSKQEAVLRAALRYLLKVQKQEQRRQKKDYDIPFPIFGYKRDPSTE